MSQEKVQEFLNTLQSNTSLGEEYKTLLTSCKELSKEKISEKGVSFAKEKGHNFSSEDIDTFSKNKNSNELTEEELNTVAGGGSFYWAIYDMQ